MTFITMASLAGCSCAQSAGVGSERGQRGGRGRKQGLAVPTEAEIHHVDHYLVDNVVY